MFTGIPCSELVRESIEPLRRLLVVACCSGIEASVGSFQHDGLLLQRSPTVSKTGMAENDPRLAHHKSSGPSSDAPLKRES